MDVINWLVYIKKGHSGCRYNKNTWGRQRPAYTDLDVRANTPHHAATRTFPWTQLRQWYVCTLRLGWEVQSFWLYLVFLSLLTLTWECTHVNYKSVNEGNPQDSYMRAKLCNQPPSYRPLQKRHGRMPFCQATALSHEEETVRGGNIIMSAALFIHRNTAP